MVVVVSVDVRQGREHECTSIGSLLIAKLMCRFIVISLCGPIRGRLVYLLQRERPAVPRYD